MTDVKWTVHFDNGRGDQSASIEDTEQDAHLRLAKMVLGKSSRYYGEAARLVGEEDYESLELLLESVFTGGESWHIESHHGPDKRYD